MQQRIRDHFRKAQCLVVISEKPVAFVIKIAKISIQTRPYVAFKYLQESDFP
jgi:hypothetical protein